MYLIIHNWKMEIKMLSTLLCLIILFATVSSKSPCEILETCGACIQNPSCAWCMNPNKCFQPQLDVQMICSEENLFNPDNTLQILENRNIRREQDSYSGIAEPASDSKIPTLMPQKIIMKLRKDSPMSVHMRYKLPEQPVDIYYLIDSKAMGNKNRNNIIYLSENLVEVLKNITSDYRIGYGSFVDKVVAPFVDIQPKKLLSPCEECASPYGFLNHMSLSTKGVLFLAEIRRFQKSGSLSNRNGGMDALMQSIVCSDEIGWRKNAVKYIIFVSDSRPHVAGDGKAAGLTVPNDQLCHLEQGSYYSQSSLRDYPSVSQINDKVTEKHIKIMFATTEDQIQHYFQISNSIEGSTVNRLTSDSSNVIDSFTESLKTESPKIPKFNHNSTSTIAVTLRENQSVKEGNLIDYTFDVQIKTCKRKTDSEIFQVFPEGETEALIIQVESICSCPCESPLSPYYQEKSSRCSYNGNYKCGYCECDPGTFGRHCECGKQEIQPDGCIPHNGRSGLDVMCSGRGYCICNQCTCDQRVNLNEKIYGKYCECDNFSCDRHQGQLCSGHGTCECGTCLCHSEWSGSDCSCLNSTQTCTPPVNGKICSGHGNCQCGRCLCETKYTGQFCEVSY